MGSEFVNISTVSFFVFNVHRVSKDVSMINLVAYVCGVQTTVKRSKNIFVVKFSTLYQISR